MLAELNELYQQAILRHSRHPQNFRALPEADRTAVGNNPLCGDHYTVFLKLADEQIVDLSFTGAGCAVSKAAGSLMTETLKGKTVSEARNLADNYNAMLRTGEVDEQLGESQSLAGVHHFPTRIKCALLPWEAMRAALNSSTKEVSTQEVAG